MRLVFLETSACFHTRSEGFERPAVWWGVGVRLGRKRCGGGGCLQGM